MLLLRLFLFNVPYQFAQILDLRPEFFGLTLFVCFVCI